jgi:hypothetical protein
MKAEMQTPARRPIGHPKSRVVAPDPPEPWSAEEVEFLLWPDTPDHLPTRQREEGWPQLLGCC